MKKLAKLIPNLITSIRIIGAIVLLFLEPLSLEFFIVYGLSGASDALDGFVARKFHLESKLGSILDSISDLLFYAVMAIKIFPTLIEQLQIWNWIIIAIPVFFHLIAYVICTIRFKKFSAIHTYANKITSIAVFFYPFTFIGMIRPLFEIYVIVFGVVAIYGSIEMVLIHSLSKRYDDRNKTIFFLRKNEKDLLQEKETI